jgi:hypothetical protein
MWSRSRTHHYNQCSKWAGMCRYNIPELLFVPEFHTGTYQYIWTTWRSRVGPRQRQKIFPLTSVSRPALGPTQPPVHWVPGILTPGAKRGWGMTLTRSWMSRSYTSSPPLRVHKCVVGLLLCFYLPVSLYSKVKLSHYTPWRRLGERSYSSYSFLTSALDEVNAVVEWLILCPIREVPGSILGHGDRPLIEIFVVFLSPSTRMPVYYLKLGHGRFLPNPSNSLSLTYNPIIDII